MRKPSLLAPRTSSSTIVTPQASLGWMAYRLALGVAGVLWICLSTTLCGCNQANGWAVNRSGQAYYRRGNFEAARFEFERALVNNPYRADYAYNIARTMEQQGDAAGAEQMYQYALTLDPAHDLSYHGLAEMLIDQGREDDAATLVQSWADTQPYLPEANMELARWQQRRGDMAGAQQSMNRAIALNPYDPKTLGQMGYFYEQSNQPQLAAAYYQQSLMLKPNQRDVKARLENIGWTPGQTPALATARRVSIMDPTMNGGFTLAGGARRYYGSGYGLSGPRMAPVSAWQYGPPGTGMPGPVMGSPLAPGMSTGMGTTPWGATVPVQPQLSMPMNYDTSYMMNPGVPNYSTAMSIPGYGSPMPAGTWDPNMTSSPGTAWGVPANSYATPIYSAEVVDPSAPQAFSATPTPLSVPYNSMAPVESFATTTTTNMPGVDASNLDAPAGYIPVPVDQQFSPPQPVNNYSPAPQFSTAPTVQAF